MSNVEIEKVSFSVDQSKILENVSVTFKENSLTCILGPNGAGKTTLIKSICRIIAAEGSIKIDEKEIHSLDRNSLARLVSYVPQTVSPDLAFTVSEFILLSRYPWQGVSEMEQEKIDEIFSLTGLEEHRFQQMKTLSGGERQRALIAAALVQDTPVILLDEVTSALDPRYQDQVTKLLLSIRQKGRTLIWATHDVNAALLNADSILCMKNGAVFAYSSPEEILQNQTLNKLYERDFLSVNLKEEGKTVLL